MKRYRIKLGTQIQFDGDLASPLVGGGNGEGAGEARRRTERREAEGISIWVVDVGEGWERFRQRPSVQWPLELPSGENHLGK